MDRLDVRAGSGVTVPSTLGVIIDVQDHGKIVTVVAGIVGVAQTGSLRSHQSGKSSGTAIGKQLAKGVTA